MTSGPFLPQPGQESLRDSPDVLGAAQGAGLADEPDGFAGWLIRRIKRRKPDFIIGGADRPYMRRWWVIPRNRVFNIYLHEILRDDDDRALHDHPWVNFSLLLSGGYVEVTGRGSKAYRAGAIRFRLPTMPHRLILPNGRPCWSLFITGPVVRTWGFHCPRGWVPWREFVDQRDTGAVGRGCGEQS